MYTKKIVDGFYYRTMHYEKRLAYCPNGSCGTFERDDGTKFLVSYSTTVLSLDKNGWLECTGTYSNTTRKHIGAWLKEYAPAANYYNAKKCYEDELAYNVHTGEYRPLKEMEG